METKEQSLLRIAEALENFSAKNLGDLTELETEDKTNLVAAVNEVVGNAEDMADDIEEIAEAQGDLADLTTTEKTNIVGAVNEVVGSVEGMADAQGDLADLTTTAKTSIIAAINELVTRVAALEPTE